MNVEQEYFFFASFRFVQRRRRWSGTRRSIQDAAGAVRLGPGRGRSLLIHYTANSFVSPERVRFQYQLQDHDQSWQEDRNNLRTAIYTDLRPGTYRFRLRAFNNYGVMSERDAEFAFSLAPHFYETWPFYVLCSAIVLAAGGSLHALRMAGIKRIKALEQHHALEMERARIAKDLTIASVPT